MMFGQLLSTHRIYKRLAQALISLSVCAGQSEPLLVAHITLLEISCHGSCLWFKANILNLYRYRALLILDWLNKNYWKSVGFDFFVKIHWFPKKPDQVVLFI